MLTGKRLLGHQSETSRIPTSSSNSHNDQYSIRISSSSNSSSNLPDMANKVAMQISTVERKGMAVTMFTPITTRPAGHIRITADTVGVMEALQICHRREERCRPGYFPSKR